eukprot:1440406-Amphidinium_carterae.1
MQHLLKMSLYGDILHRAECRCDGSCVHSTVLIPSYCKAPQVHMPLHIASRTLCLLDALAPSPKHLARLKEMLACAHYPSRPPHHTSQAEICAFA